MSGTAQQPPENLELSLSSSNPALAEDTKLLDDPRQNGEAKQSYPKSIFFIICNEFCERFSYYGMRAILTLYLTKRLGFNADDGTAIFHVFVIICYFTPLFGAILADGYIGKYWTIMALSVVYLCGNVIMTFTAFPPPNRVGPLIGLLLIGIGTGGIKPCVSAFGGDQFTADQETARAQFFSFFYFTINFGSLLSMLITPLVREYVQCFGAQCYPLAFGIPAALMLVSIGLFILGTPFYKKQPATGSVIQDFFMCIWTALRRRCQLGNQGKEHWIEYAEGIYDHKFIADVKAVLRVLVIFIPVPIYWSLYDQQGSRWNLQGIHLDKRITDDFYLPADIVPAVNPILIMMMIPLFDFVIYPLFDKCHLITKLPQRMTAGMLIISLTFIVSAVLQIQIQRESTYHTLKQGESSVFFINAASCPVNFQSDLLNGTIAPLTQTKSQIVTNGPQNPLNFEALGCALPHPKGKPLHLSLNRTDQFIVTAIREGNLESKLFSGHAVNDTLEGSLVGVLGIGAALSRAIVTLSRIGGTEPYVYNVTDFSTVQYLELMPGRYEGTLTIEGGTPEPLSLSAQSAPLQSTNRAVMTILIHTAQNSTTNLWEMTTFINTEGATVSVWWQFPQYLLVSTAEILFAISGLRFAYDEAPVALKSVVTAFWLLTTAFGSVIVAIVAEAHMSSRVTEFFLFAGLMAVTTVLFGYLAYRYKYNHPSSYTQPRPHTQ